VAHFAHGDDAVSWHASGSYFESCNCDAHLPVSPNRRRWRWPFDARHLHGHSLLDHRRGRGGRRRPGGSAGRDGHPLQR